MHVAVGSDAGIAEQVPRATQVLTPFEDGEGTVGTVHLQVVGGRDTRDAGTDDEHVEVVFGVARQRGLVTARHGPTLRRGRVHIRV